MNRPLNGGSPSPHSADSNAPTSSQSLISSALQSSRQSLLHDGQITPSISLIPIKQVRKLLASTGLESFTNDLFFSRPVSLKINRSWSKNWKCLKLKPNRHSYVCEQEPNCDDYDGLAKSGRQHSGDQQSSSSSSSSSSSMQNLNSIVTNSVESSVPSSSSLTSLIKVRHPPPFPRPEYNRNFGLFYCNETKIFHFQVSPLKSLLREDLKRRISARASNRASRNSNNANGLNSESASNGLSSSIANSSTMSSSSTAPSQNPSSISFSKIGSSASSLTNTINAISQHLLSNSSITVTTESTTTSAGMWFILLMFRFVRLKAGTLNVNCVWNCIRHRLIQWNNITKSFGCRCDHIKWCNHFNGHIRNGTPVGRCIERTSWQTYASVPVLWYRIPRPNIVFLA